MKANERGWQMSREEWYEFEAREALPFVTKYTSGDFPNDQLIQSDEDGRVTEYPPDHPKYV
jgi:hypothetical protein